MNRSDAAVGAELATKEAQLLEAGEMLAYRHRDYCGMGLRYAEGRFICGEVDD
ncbi:hypothetical protein [Luteimonas panaciterrae]|uniref:hypothetical protein n=1 Tax=Luteimonas panaciterrae TaxID=363885 RepID=UPI001CFB15E0|nr:hypothetical protein [Luteimonas panaciterrae]